MTRSGALGKKCRAISNTMNILITGGAGFIGSHLAELLLEDPNNRLTVIDNLATGKFTNIEHLTQNDRYRLIVGSVTDTVLVEPLIAESQHIYHLGAGVGVRRIIEYPVETIETNILGTESVLKLAAKYHKKVLIASTSEVYGKNNKTPFSEEDDSVFGATTKSRWSYACSKAIDEFLSLAYHKEKGLPVVICRFFNTVGPRQTGRYGMVIPNLVRQALRNEDLTVYGNGQQSRCFTHVKDSIRCQQALMNHPRAVGEIFNLGSNQEVTIKQLAERIIELTGSKSKIVFIPYEQAYEAGFEDMQRRVPNTDKLRNLLGFAPTTDLDSILNDVIAYFQRDKTIE
jgi:UDP-glucose 4-epimerase